MPPQSYTESGYNATLFEFFIAPQGSGVIIGPLIMVAIFLCGAFNFHWIWPVIFIIYIYGYWSVQSERAKRTTLWGVQSALRDPVTARSILGGNLAPWVTFAAREKSGWMQTLINGIWPQVTGVLQNQIVSAVDPVMAEKKPSLLTALHMGYVDFGDIPPQAEGFNCYSTDTSTIIDINLRWAGNPDVRVVAESSVVSMEVVLTNLEFRSLLRIEMGPHCDKLPCFGSLSICFVGKPTLDYHLQAAKISFDAIPGLREWLDSFLQDILTVILVYPRRMVFELLKDVGKQETDVEPVGCITIHIVSAYGLPDRDFFGTMRTYVKGVVSTVDNKEATEARTMIAKGRSPIYEDRFVLSQEQERDSGGIQFMNVGIRDFQDVTRLIPVVGSTTDSYTGKRSSEMMFPVYQVPEEQILLEVWTVTSENVGARFRYEQLLGHVHIYTGDLQKGTNTLTTPLSHPDATKNQSSGTLTYSYEFLPFQKVMPGDERNEADGTEGLSEQDKEAMQKTRRREDTSVVASSISDFGAAPVVDRSVMFKAHHEDKSSTFKHSQKQQRGMLFIHLVRGDNLLISDINGSSDPFCKMAINKHEASSSIVYMSLHPHWDEKHFLMVDDLSRDDLVVKVYDHDMFSSDVLGHIRIPIRENVQPSPQYSPMKAFQLDTEGTITLSFKLRLYD